MFSKIKKWAAPLLLLAGFAGGFASCSTDFDVAAPYKDITAVYGMLSMNDSANTHYIRIQKAFLDENTSALVMSKIPDSSFYDSLQVTVQELNNGAAVGSPITLQRVDLSKEPGQFFTEPNYVYRFVQALNPARRYRLRISNPKNGSEIFGETGVIDTSLSVFRIAEYNQNQFTINILKDTDRTAKSFVLNVTPPNNFENGTVRYYEGSMRIKWVDKVTSTGLQTDHFVDWNFFSTASTSGFLQLEMGDVAFYNFLLSNIGPAPAGVERLIDSFDVSVRMAAQSYNQYRNLTAARGGLTADQIQANFTNLTGPDVLGLLSTRAYRVRNNVPVTDATLLRIRTSNVTNKLNFTGRSDH